MKAPTYNQLRANYIAGDYGQIIEGLSDRLKLAFITDTFQSAGNVCFAYESNLRPEFRLSFTAEDLLDFLLALSKSKNPAHINQLPNDITEFWQLVETGARLRKTC